MRKGRGVQKEKTAEEKEGGEDERREEGGKEKDGVAAGKDEEWRNEGKWGGRYCFALFSLCSLITNPKPEKQPVFLAVTQTH